jgi:glycosyltransferase involved in cell wall biosynthesis
MLCIVHGYGLNESGSNLWTREVVRALVRNGETVHLVCRVSDPENFDFVSEAFAYDAEGTPERLLARETPGYSGRCVLHRPHADVVPTYVRPRLTQGPAKCILDLPDEPIATYLAHQEAALRSVVRNHGVEAIHVNHMVLMAEAVRRIHESDGLPFVLMPHGSALEYVVKKDPRMHEIAGRVLAAAECVVTISAELQERILAVYPGMDGLEERMTRVPPGVDVTRFDLLPRERRGESLEALRRGLAGRERGRTAEQTATFREGLSDDLSRREAEELFRAAGRFSERAPEATLEEGLDRIDPERDEIFAFVGRFLGHKGVTDIVAALPRIFAERPDAKLVLAGGGPLREVLEALLVALSKGHRTLVRNLLAWGDDLEGQQSHPMARVESFLDDLESKGELDDYFRAAEEHVDPDRVIFTGFLEHDLLQYLLPCCDVGVFPSHVPEAGPLVAVEAMASGCFPSGTYQAGMASILDAARDSGLPEEAVELARISPREAHSVADLAEKIPKLLEVAPRYRAELRRVAEERFGWRSVAAAIAETLRAAAGQPA